MENTYTIYEEWREPFLDSIRKQMRLAYETSSKAKKEKLNNFDREIFSEESFVKGLFK